MKFLFLLFLFSYSQLASAQLKTDFSGNLEAQARHTWNNTEAQEFPQLQTWDEENFYLLYGNINGKAEFKNSRAEANLFGRYSRSELYERDFVATRIYTFPNRLVARELFDLNHEKQGHESRQELVINKLYYELDLEDNRFTMGRMYINYGLGEIFNPINPFNQPTGITSISQVAQGNDGLAFTFFINDKYTMDFFFLGDKSRPEDTEDDDNEIERTLWVHGEYQATDKFQLDYVAGQDQNRFKLGTQGRYSFEEAMAFFQLLYQTDEVDDTKSHPLWDVLIGLDQQLNSKWHARLEGGYQKANRFATFASISERFLPMEYFLAAALQFEVHPLLKLTGTLINDVKTGFTYFVSKNTLDLGHDTEMELFAFVPAAKGDNIENVAQKLVTTDVGIALRTFF